MEKKRYYEIDYMRFVCMIIVFLVHTRGYIHVELISNTINYLGISCVVATFFVISGFLSFASNYTSAREYYLNRFLRIYTVYLIVFNLDIIYFCVIKKTLEFSLHRYVIGTLGLQMAIPCHDVTWNGLAASGSLSAIICFYILVPLLRKYVTTQKRAFVLLFVGIILCDTIRILSTIVLADFGDSAIGIAYFSPQTNMWYFFVGILLFYIKDNIKLGHIILEIVGLFISWKVVGPYTYSFYTLMTALFLSVFWKYSKKWSFKKPNRLIMFYNKIGLAFWLIHAIIIECLSSYLMDKPYIDWLILFVLTTLGGMVITSFANGLSKLVKKVLGKEELINDKK